MNGEQGTFMKPYLLAAALLAGLASAAAAEVSGGLKTGVNISNFVGDGAGAGSSRIPRAGLMAGGYVIFPVRNAPFKIQAEGLISSKGAIYKWDLLGSAYETIIKLTYLEIPVLARFDIESRGGAKPALYLGPSFGIKLSAQAESRTVGSSSSGNIDNVRSLDPGIVLGGVIDMETSKGHITIEARYTRGLVNVYESSGDSDSDAELKNSVGTVLLGYRF